MSTCRRCTKGTLADSTRSKLRGDQHAATASKVLVDCGLVKGKGWVGPNWQTLYGPAR